MKYTSCIFAIWNHARTYTYRQTLMHTHTHSQVTYTKTHTQMYTIEVNLESNIWILKQKYRIRINFFNKISCLPTYRVKSLKFRGDKKCHYWCARLFSHGIKLHLYFLFHNESRNKFKCLYRCVRLKLRFKDIAAPFLPKL